MLKSASSLAVVETGLGGSCLFDTAALSSQVARSRGEAMHPFRFDRWLASGITALPPLAIFGGARDCLFVSTFDARPIVGSRGKFQKF